MQLLDTITIICSGLLVGNELSVSAFVNPAVWQLDDRAQAKGASLLARSLGKVMPLWYTLCFALLAAEAYLHRDQARLTPLLVSLLVWIGITIYTILFLVPINKRVAALTLTSLPATWRLDHKKWDTLHRWRIVLLVVAVSTLTYGLVGPR
ncbi:MAG TPA: DUF1772 domain-containing protein [Bryobacteraceae bacterium]|jgi:uncharacterized membrane protein